MIRSMLAMTSPFTSVRSTSRGALRPALRRPGPRARVRCVGEFSDDALDETSGHRLGQREAYCALAALVRRKFTFQLRTDDSGHRIQRPVLLEGGEVDDGLTITLVRRDSVADGFFSTRQRPPDDPTHALQHRLHVIRLARDIFVDPANDRPRQVHPP